MYNVYYFFILIIFIFYFIEIYMLSYKIKSTQKRDLHDSKHKQ